jgi:DNA-binding transcriptional LysR family regulator
MELKTLRYFATVAEELHFGRAAKRLHVSQPPLSRQMQNLEHELGSVLFHRTSRHVELTPTGEIFLQQIIPILSAVDEAVGAVRRAERGEIGRLVIGYFRGAIYTLLPVILRHFRTQAPKVELVLREMNIAEVPQALSERTIDVGFLRPPVADPSVATEIVLRESLVAALPMGHRLASKPQIKLADLALEPFVMFGPSPSLLGDQIKSACYRAGFNPRVVQQARHPEALIGLVRSGAGVALVAASAQIQGRSGVRFKKVTGPLPKAEIVMAWRRNESTPLLRTFLDTARTAVSGSAGKNLKRIVGAMTGASL